MLTININYKVESSYQGNQFLEMTIDLQHVQMCQPKHLYELENWM